jgi:hypothetical protein
VVVVEDAASKKEETGVRRARWRTRRKKRKCPEGWIAEEFFIRLVFF